MSAMRREVFDAFRAAGVPDEKAAAAAEAIEANREEGRFRQVEDGLVRFESRLGRVEGELGRFESRLGRVEGELGRFESRLGGVEGELGRFEGRLRHVEEELARLDGRVMLLTWMVGFNLALTAAVLARLLFIH